MADGPALLDNKAGTLSDRVQSSQRMCPVQPIRRPALWEWVPVGVWSLFELSTSCVPVSALWQEGLR